MTRKIAPLFEVWKQVKIKGSWTDWLLTGTFETQVEAETAIREDGAARYLRQWPYPCRYEIRKIQVTVASEATYTPRSEWKAVP